MERTYTKIIFPITEAVQKLPDPEKSKTSGEDWPHILTAADNTNKQAVRYIERSRNGYMYDGLIRQAVDIFAESYNGITLTSPTPAIVDKLKTRLEIMSLVGDEHWESLFSRYIHEMWRTGTSLLLKIRGRSAAATRAMWEEAPFAIAGFKLINIMDYEAKHTAKHKLVWKRKDRNAINSVIDNSAPLQNFLIVGKTYDNDKTELRNHIDVVPLYYKKIPGVDYGWGLSWPSLEDVVSLRSFERATLVMAKKFMNPLIHHKINRAIMPGQDIDRDIARARYVHQNRGPDGVIFTGPNDEITIHGSESQAMRVDGFLSHFSNRGFAGLSVTPFMMGFADGSNGGAEASKVLTSNKRIFNLNEVAKTLEFYVLWELLYEMGYNPYENENHRVHIIFNDIDQDVQIKRQNHYVDLWVKGAIDFDEMRTAARLFGKFNPNKSYTELIDKKKASYNKEKSEQKKINQPKKSTPSNNKEELNFPLSKNKLEEFLKVNFPNFEFSTDIIANLKALMDTDISAAQAYLANLEGVQGYE